jgi:hypothetical protein
MKAYHWSQPHQDIYIEHKSGFEVLSHSEARKLAMAIFTLLDGQNPVKAKETGSVGISEDPCRKLAIQIVSLPYRSQWHEHVKEVEYMIRELVTRDSVMTPYGAPPAPIIFRGINYVAETLAASRQTNSDSIIVQSTLSDRESQSRQPTGRTPVVAG